MPLSIITGPMFGGKSTQLIKDINEYYDVSDKLNKNIRGILINSTKDTREKKVGNLSSNSNIDFFLTDKIKKINTDKLSNISDDVIKNYDFICIDEVQFFPDLKQNVLNWLNYKKKIICCGLLSDIDKNIFGELLYLIPYSENIEFKKAYCLECGNLEYKNACFTKLKSNIIKPDNIIASGYETFCVVCDKHYN